MQAIEREKETRPKSHYDLSWKLKKSENKLKKSPSMSHIQTVRPVESTGSIEVKAFDSPKVPIKKQYLQLNAADNDEKGNSAQINAITNKLNEIAISRYMRKNFNNGSAFLNEDFKRKVIFWW